MKHGYVSGTVLGSICIRQVVTVLSDFGIRKLTVVEVNNYSMAICSLGETQRILLHPGVFLLHHISRHEEGL